MITWQKRFDNDPPWDADQYTGRYLLLIIGCLVAILAIVSYTHHPSPQKPALTAPGPCQKAN